MYNIYYMCWLQIESCNATEVPKVLPPMYLAIGETHKSRWILGQNGQKKVQPLMCGRE